MSERCLKLILKATPGDLLPANVRGVQSSGSMYTVSEKENEEASNFSRPCAFEKNRTQYGAQSEQE